MGARFGRYETLYPLASGGMATVHLARAIGAGGFERLVAIKVMHAGLGEDPEFGSMFLDEARVAARIRHPNVVGTVDVQEGPEGLFLVMEFVEGPSLFAMQRAVAKQGRRIPLGVALRILIDALLGLHAAHEQTGPTGEPLQIVHRDVSPQNILVSVDGQTKITDFGVARAEARLTSTRRGEVKGKLAYMSPQQVRAEDVDRRADVYGAAVVLWELLAGERLFRSDNDGALVVSVMAGAQKSPREVDPSVPAAIDRECMRALRVDPAERHPTALAFAEALEVAAEEAGVTLATPRVVSAFVKELGAHKPVVVPPSSEGAFAPSSRASAPSFAEGAPSGPGFAGASGGVGVGAPVTEILQSAPGVPSPAPSMGAPPEANSQVASVLSATGLPAAPPRPSARTIAVVAGVFAVLGIAAATGVSLLAGAGRAPSTPAGLPASSTPEPTTVAAATATPTAAGAPPVEPSASAAAATASAGAEPVKPPSQPSSVARPKAASPPRTPKAPKGATGWRPDGL